MIIPDEAVEAAAQSLFENSPVSRAAKPWSDQVDKLRTQFRADARDALEAAAPILFANWPLSGAVRVKGNCYVRHEVAPGVHQDTPHTHDGEA